MEEWSIKVEGRRPPEDGGWFEADELELVGESLAEHYPALGGGPSLEARITVEADSAGEALSRAVRLYSQAVAEALDEEIEVVAVEVMTAERLEEELLGIDDREVLLGVAETAELLGVSKTRVGNLREQSYFPEPVVELASGPVWRRIDLKGFERRWDRRSGPKTARTLREAREALGRSLGEVAEAVHLPKDVLLKVERGRIASQTLPKKLLDRLGEVLSRSGEQIRDLVESSTRTGVEPRSVLYKAKGSPKEPAGEPERFEDALGRSTNLDQEQQTDWLTEDEGTDREGRK